MEDTKSVLFKFFILGMENVKCDECGNNPNGRTFDDFYKEIEPSLAIMVNKQLYAAYNEGCKNGATDVLSRI